MIPSNLEYIAGQVCNAAHIVSMLVEHATEQNLPESHRPSKEPGYAYLCLLDEDLNALIHAAYEAERFAKETQAAIEAALTAEAA